MEKIHLKRQFWNYFPLFSNFFATNKPSYRIFSDRNLFFLSPPLLTKWFSLLIFAT